MSIFVSISLMFTTMYFIEAKLWQNAMLQHKCRENERAPSIVLYEKGKNPIYRRIVSRLGSFQAVVLFYLFVVDCRCRKLVRHVISVCLTFSVVNGCCSVVFFHCDRLVLGDWKRFKSTLAWLPSFDFAPPFWFCHSSGIHSLVDSNADVRLKCKSGSECVNTWECLSFWSVNSRCNANNKKKHPKIFQRAKRQLNGIICEIQNCISSGANKVLDATSKLM